MSSVTINMLTDTLSYVKYVKHEGTHNIGL